MTAAPWRRAWSRFCGTPSRRTLLKLEAGPDREGAFQIAAGRLFHAFAGMGAEAVIQRDEFVSLHLRPPQGQRADEGGILQRYIGTVGQGARQRHQRAASGVI